MKTKILITGGLGYVGGRIIKELIETTDFEISISSRRDLDVSKIFQTNRVVLISTEFLFNPSNELPDKFDYIIHLAAMNEIQSEINPPEAIQVNTLNSYFLLQKAVKNKVKRFVYFSTAHVYCTPLIGDISENTCPKPMHPYAITHKGFEDFLFAAHQKKEIEGVIFRLSNSFGAPIFADVDRWTLLVNDLCRQVVKTRELKLNSTGIQLRDFVTLTDVCRAVDFILKLPSNKLDDGLFNLGGNFTTSIFEMAQIIQGRAEIKMKCPIVLSRPEIKNFETSPSFSFLSSKLTESGFQWTKKIDEEIDNLLDFCLLNFK